MTDTSYIFANARWALFWSADVLRRGYLPRISAFWRESGGEGAAEVAMMEPDDTIYKERLWLPADAEERQGLALKVDALLRLMGEGGTLLRQMAWGDAWNDASLRVAMAHREAARRQGMKIRISYRYTYRQLAALHDCDPKVVWRRVRAALLEFRYALARAGLLWLPEAGDTAKLAPRRVQAIEFKDE